MINRSASDPDVVWVTELWMSQEALDGSLEQLSTDEGKARIAEIIALLAGPPELTELEPLGGVGYLPGGTGYTHLNLEEDVEDMAKRFGFGEQGEARFANRPLGAVRTGVSHQRVRPGVRQAFGHRHQHAEEVVRRARRRRPDQDRRRDQGRAARSTRSGSPRVGPSVRGRTRRPRVRRVRAPPHRRRRHGLELLAHGGDMSTTQINQNLIQINRWRFVNAFLVREDDGFTLVDTTVGGGADELVAAARGAGGEIKRIALTHGHGDHVGSLDALKQKLGNEVEVLMPELDARIHAGEKVTGKKPPGSWPKITTEARRPPDRRRADRQPRGRRRRRGTPPGTSSFLDTRDRTVIVGDTLTSIGGLAVSNHLYWRFPLAAMATWDKAKDRRVGQEDPRARPGAARGRPRRPRPRAGRGARQGDRARRRVSA